MRLKFVGALITAVALAVGLAAPAHAETFSDPVGDVAQISPKNHVTFVGGSPDIAKVTATITPAWFTVAITLTTPAEKGWDRATVLLDTDKNGSPDYSIEIIAKNGTVLNAKARKWSSFSALGDVRVKAQGKTLTITTRADIWPKPTKNVSFAVSMGRIVDSKTVDSRIDDFPSRIHGQPKVILGPIVWQALKPTPQKVTALKDTTPTVKLVKATVKKGKAAKLKVSVKQKVSGTVFAYDGFGQDLSLGSATLAKGKTVTLKLPKNLAVKTHAIRVRFMPDTLTYASSWSQFVTLVVKK